MGLFAEDLGCLDPCIFQCLHDRATCALDEIAHQLLQPGPRQGHYQVLRAAGISADKRQIDFCLHGRRELNLGALCRFLHALECHAILKQVNALFLAELVGNPINNPLVEVIATQVGVAICRLNLKNAFT